MTDEENKKHQLNVQWKQHTNSVERVRVTTIKKCTGWISMFILTSHCLNSGTLATLARYGMSRFLFYKKIEEIITKVSSIPVLETRNDKPFGDVVFNYINMN